MCLVVAGDQFLPCTAKATAAAVTADDEQLRWNAQRRLRRRNERPSHKLADEAGAKVEAARFARKEVVEGNRARRALPTLRRRCNHLHKGCDVARAATCGDA